MSCCYPAGTFLSRLPSLAPELACLDLSGCGGLSGGDLSGLMASLKGLERLVLDGIEEVSTCVLEECFRGVAGSTKQEKYIAFSYYISFHFSAKCKRL